MNPPSDMKTEPLTAEERALAQRLARLGPDGEPSPGLDARILAAAHDAVSKHASQRRPHRRWPVAFGIAASLALAIGIAWQLRPLPQTAIDRSEAPVAAPAQAASANAVADAPQPAAAAEASAVAPQSDAIAADSPPPPAAKPAAAEAPARAEPAPPAPAPAPPTPVAPVLEPDIVFDRAAAAADTAAQSAKTVAAPRAFSPTPAFAPAPSASDKRFNAAAAADAAGTLPETDTLDRLQSTGAREAAVSDEPATEVPPATMASPAARDAWLTRIRELLAVGRTDAARASLREFVHRYPDEPLPDDLRALSQ